MEAPPLRGRPSEMCDYHPPADEYIDNKISEKTLKEDKENFKELMKLYKSSQTHNERLNKSFNKRVNFIITFSDRGSDSDSDSAVFYSGKLGGHIDKGELAHLLEGFKELATIGGVNELRGIDLEAPLEVQLALLKKNIRLDDFEILLGVEAELKEALLKNEETYKQKYNIPANFEDKILKEELNSTEIENYVRYLYFKMETDIIIYDKHDEKLVNPELFHCKYKSEYPFALSRGE